MQEITIARKFPEITLGPFKNVAVSTEILANGTFSWPGDPFLASRLIEDFHRLILDIYRERRSVGAKTLLLRAKLGIDLANRLYYYQLATDIERERPAGFLVRSIDALTAQGNRDLYVARSTIGQRRFRQALARWLQLAALRVLDWSRLPRPLILTAPADEQTRLWRWLIRAPHAFLGRPRRLPWYEEDLKHTSDAFARGVADICKNHEIQLTAADYERIGDYVLTEIKAAYCDYLNFRDTLGRRPFDYVTGTVSAYLPSLIATVAKDSGGEARATVHGGCVFAFMDPVSSTLEFVNSSVFTVPSRRAAENAKRIIDRELKGIPCCEIRVSEVNKYERYVPSDTSPKKINKIMVMGIIANPERILGYMIPFPIYLDYERRMIRFLLEQGYEVTYKAHPENPWRRHDLIFDGKVSIEYTPFEKINHDHDAEVYLFMGTSTLIRSLSSGRYIYHVDDGRTHTWNDGMYEVIKERCEIIPAFFDGRNRIIFDEQRMAERLRNPKPVAARHFMRFIGTEEADG